MNRCFWILAFCLPALLAACAPGSEPAPTTTPTRGAGVTPSVAPTSTAVASPTAGPALELVDTRWDLVSLQGEKVLPGARINLELGSQTLGGFTGCNYYGGGSDGGAYVATADGAFRLGPQFAVTLIGCPEDVMVREQAYLDALRQVTGYRVAGDRLELVDAGGTTLLVYARRAACSEPPAVLAGTAWQLVSVDGAPPQAGAASTLAFVDGEWVTQSSVCDAYVSVYQTSGSTLGFPFTTWLGRACGEGQSAALEMPGDYCVEGRRLRITGVPGAVYLYEPLTEVDRPTLEGRTWTLLAVVGSRRLEGESFAAPDPVPVLDGTQITLELALDKAAGAAGCNRYGAGYALDGDSLSFGAISATEKACLDPEGVMSQERDYLALLPQVTSFQIAGGLLWLRTPGDRSLVFLDVTP